MHALTFAALASFAADQASKLYIIHVVNLPFVGSVDVIDPLLNFRWAENRGVNFGLMYNDADFMRWVLIGLAVVISAWVVHWARRDQFGTWGLISAGLLVGGAAGNVVDRIAYGYVADFLNMSCCGLNNPYVFNVADIGIFAGAIGLVLFTGNSQSGKGARKIG